MAFSVVGMPAATKTFNWKTFPSQLLPQGTLEGEPARIDVERVEGKTNASWDLLLNLSNLGAKSDSIIVATTSQLNMVPSIQDGTDETCFHG